MTKDSGEAVMVGGKLIDDEDDELIEEDEVDPMRVYAIRADAKAL